MRLERAAEHLLAAFSSDIRCTSVGAVPFLKLLGIVSGGWMMTRAALAARARLAAGETDSFYGAKVASADFYAAHVLAGHQGLAQVVVGGGASALAIEDDLL